MYIYTNLFIIPIDKFKYMMYNINITGINIQ